MTLAAHDLVGAPATWVLSNHDVTRPVTRYGRADSSFAFDAKRSGTPTNVALGVRRARAAALLVAALPGSLYVYQGDELGLPEAEDLPAAAIQDPMHFRSHGVDPGRDGCRVPLPWSGAAAPFGFSPAGTATAPWLPQPADWAHLTVEAQQSDPASMLRLYRDVLAIRRAEPDLGDGPMDWIETDDDVLAFARGPRFACVANLGENPVDLPAHAGVLLASGALTDSRLPGDTAVWLRLPAPS
jgi:alpha-glucosidase